MVAFLKEQTSYPAKVGPINTSFQNAIIKIATKMLLRNVKTEIKMRALQEFIITRPGFGKTQINYFNLPGKSQIHNFCKPNVCSGAGCGAIYRKHN